MREDKNDTRTGGRLRVVVDNRRGRVGVHANRDMPQPLVFMLGASVKVEYQAVFVDLDVGDGHALTGLRGQTAIVNRVDIVRTRGLHGAVGVKRQRADRKRTHGESLLSL